MIYKCATQNVLSIFQRSGKKNQRETGGRQLKGLSKADAHKREQQWIMYVTYVQQRQAQRHKPQADCDRLPTTTATTARTT